MPWTPLTFLEASLRRGLTANATEVELTGFTSKSSNLITWKRQKDLGRSTEQIMGDHQIRSFRFGLQQLLTYLNAEQINTFWLSSSLGRTCLCSWAFQTSSLSSIQSWLTLEVWAPGTLNILPQDAGTDRFACGDVSTQPKKVFNLLYYLPFVDGTYWENTHEIYWTTFNS